MDIDRTTWRSPNHSPRAYAIDSIAIHDGEGNSSKSDLSWLCSAASEVSAHFYIDRAGLVYQLVDLHRVAWHAGKCWYRAGWFWRADWNSRSIGIETEHKSGQDWPPLQVSRLAELCASLQTTYKIKPEMIVAHKWIAWPRGRKVDPTNWPNEKLHSFVANLSAIKRYKINLDILPSARIRERTEVSSTVPILGTLRPGTPVCGRMVPGVPYNGVDAWLELMPGPGYIWSGLVGSVA